MLSSMAGFHGYAYAEHNYDLKKELQYVEALTKFNAALKSFQDEVPRVSQLSMEERARFVSENYQIHLLNLSNNRRKGFEMGFITSRRGNIDELKMFSSAINVGWKLWPDCWPGLMFMLYHLEEHTLPEDIARLETETMRTLKEIATCTVWPNKNNPPLSLVYEAKNILTRKKTGVRFLPAVFGGRHYDSRKICYGVDCFDIETEAVQFKRCGQCLKPCYCSRKCQVKAWKAGHKKVCAKPG